MRHLRVAIVALTVVLVGSASLDAQNPLVLRYDPIPDVTVHTLFQTFTRTVTAEGRVVETADLGSMRSVALELEEGGTVLHLAYDSVRARIRSGGGEWREFAVPGADSVWVQANVDERLNVSASWARSPLPAVTGLVDILTGIPDLTLPEQPIHLGGAWLVESRLPERAKASVPQEVGRLPSLTFSTRVRLDSTVQRTQDTLGYFTVTGYIRPTSETDLRTLAAEGIAIWSLVRHRKYPLLSKQPGSHFPHRNREWHL